MKSHQLINQSSRDYEFHTAPFILEAARRVMGGIDLDPASSAKANERVNAKYYFTDEDDGLRQKWFGRVWMNHPFGRGEKACPEDCVDPGCFKRGWHLNRDIASNAEWINKLVEEYDCGNVQEALCITYAATSEAWFQPLLDYPQCFLTPRTNYLLPDGTVKKGVTKGSVVTLMGSHLDRFVEVFGDFGVVKVRAAVMRRRQFVQTEMQP